MTAIVTVEDHAGNTRTVQTQTTQAQTVPNEQQRFVFAFQPGKSEILLRIEILSGLENLYSRRDDFGNHKCYKFKLKTRMLVSIVSLRLNLLVLDIMCLSSLF